MYGEVFQDYCLHCMWRETWCGVFNWIEFADIFLELSSTSPPYIHTIMVLIDGCGNGNKWTFVGNSIATRPEKKNICCIRVDWNLSGDEQYEHDDVIGRCVPAVESCVRSNRMSGKVQWHLCTDVFRPFLCSLSSTVYTCNPLSTCVAWLILWFHSSVTFSPGWMLEWEWEMLWRLHRLCTSSGFLEFSMELQIVNHFA